MDHPHVVVAGQRPQAFGELRGEIAGIARLRIGMGVQITLDCIRGLLSQIGEYVSFSQLGGDAVHDFPDRVLGEGRTLQAFR